MPFIKIIVHAVWATKDRKHFLTKEKRDTLIQHIRENALTKHIHVLNINGHTDHLHLLLSLEAEQNIAALMHLIKGESSFWANRNLTFAEQFGWQDEYFAVSVSQSHIDVVSRYIDRQEEHHRTKTFQEEYDAFIANYQFEQ
jgi:putative transposase